MPANENTSVQLNFKLGQALINVYAENGPEALELAEFIDKNAVRLAEIQGALDAAYNAASPNAGQQHQVPQQRQAPAPQQQGGAPQGDGGSCAHGAYIWKDFQSKAGNQVKGWFCPGPGRTDCPPKFKR